MSGPTPVSSWRSMWRCPECRRVYYRWGCCPGCGATIEAFRDEVAARLVALGRWWQFWKGTRWQLRPEDDDT